MCVCVCVSRLLLLLLLLYSLSARACVRGRSVVYRYEYSSPTCDPVVTRYLSVYLALVVFVPATCRPTAGHPLSARWSYSCVSPVCTLVLTSLYTQLLITGQFRRNSVLPYFFLYIIFKVLYDNASVLVLPPSADNVYIFSLD